jgi:hypothetical protein
LSNLWIAWVCRKRSIIKKYQVSQSYLEDIRKQLRLTGGIALDYSRDPVNPSSDTVDKYCSSAELNAIIHDFFN